MNVEQLINNKIFCATTRIYAYLTEASRCNNKTAYVDLKEIMHKLELSENTVRNAIRKLANNNLIELGNQKRIIEYLIQ